MASTATVKQQRRGGGGGGDTSKGPKRRNERNILTFYEKIAVIRYYDETNISRNSLAKMFHCCATQIRRILERKDELMQQLATLSEADASIIIEEMTRKRRKFEMSAISFILHQWVERCRQLRLRKSITNQTLKETALKMAAILNLPSFRPSYRWLNRFRGKYKYNEQDLGAVTAAGDLCTITGELSVEDIIIEFKDALPSFMQKEIAAITCAAAKVDDKSEETLVAEKRLEVPLLVNENSEDYEISDDDEDDEEAEDAPVIGTVEITATTTNSNSRDSLSPLSSSNEEHSSAEVVPQHTAPLDIRMTAGSAALLNGVFPHLAIVHQFAMLNTDIKALELISLLGVHMQTQAAEGAYRKLSLATTRNGSAAQSKKEPVGAIYADIDDIILIE